MFSYERVRARREDHGPSNAPRTPSLLLSTDYAFSPHSEHSTTPYDNSQRTLVDFSPTNSTRTYLKRKGGNTLDRVLPLTTPPKWPNANTRSVCIQRATRKSEMAGTTRLRASPNMARSPRTLRTKAYRHGGGNSWNFR